MPGAPGAGVPALVALVGITFFGAVLQGVSGFGFALFCVPLLTVVLGGSRAVVLATVLGGVSSVSVVWRDRESIERTLATRVVAGAVAGMPFGLTAHLVVSDRVLRLVVAVVAIGFVGVLASGRRLERPGRRTDVVAGFVSGVLNTSVSTNGPPVVMVTSAHGLAPSAFRATNAAALVASNVVALCLFAGARRVSPHDVEVVAIASPGLMLGSLLGWRVGSRLGQRRFRAVTLVMLAVSGFAAFGAALRA